MLSMTQAIVRPSTDKFTGYTHTDGGEGLREIRVTDDSRPIAMKAMYLLSDVDGDDCGGFTVYPGSHRQEFPWRSDPPLNPHSKGQSSSTARPAIATSSPMRCGMGPPQSVGTVPQDLLYNYCQMFVRSYDHELTPEVEGHSALDSVAFSAISAIAFGPARTSMSRLINRRSSAAQPTSQNGR